MLPLKEINVCQKALRHMMVYRMVHSCNLPVQFGFLLKQLVFCIPYIYNLKDCLLILYFKSIDFLFIKQQINSFIYDT